MSIALTILFLLAILFSKSWVAVVVAIFIAPYEYGSAIIIIGGALMDAVLGAPIAALGGFAHMYLFTTIVIALCTYLIHDRVSA